MHRFVETNLQAGHVPLNELAFKWTFSTICSEVKKSVISVVNVCG